MGLSRARIVIDPPKPTSTAEIGAGHLRALLSFVVAVPAMIFLSDSKHYRLCNQKDISVFLTRDLTDRIKYVDQRMDCDDFTFRLMGQFSIPPWSDLALGIMWTLPPRAHALICYVDERSKLWYLEPQTDQIRGELLSQFGSGVRLVMM